MGVAVTNLGMAMLLGIVLHAALPYLSMHPVRDI